MGSKCYVRGCNSKHNVRSARNKKYYVIPKIVNNQGIHERELSKRRRELWIRSTGNSSIVNSLKNPRVCSDHFVKGKPSLDFNEIDWIPTVNLPPEGQVIFRPTEIDVPPVEPPPGLMDHNYGFPDQVPDFFLPVTDADISIGVEEVTVTATQQCTNPLCQEEINNLRLELEQKIKEHADFVEQLNSLQKELQIRTEEEESLTLQQLEIIRNVCVSENQNFFHRMKNDPEMITFYTGLQSYSHFQIILDLCLPAVVALPGDDECREPTLSFKKQLYLTLMRLRLNLSDLDLACIFEIDIFKVSRYIQKWIDVMYVRFSRVLMVWPVWAALNFSMPLSFRAHYPRCIAIIDCFEVSVDDRHTDLFLDRESTRSKRAIKFIIAISPTGAITFISKAYGGHEPDADIVHDSEFLRRILPGDQILANRDFLIEEAVRSMGASLITPANVGNSKSVSNLAICVKKVIDHLRSTYTILNGPLSVNDMRTGPDGVAFVDKVAFVCCCLLNSGPSVVIDTGVNAV